MTRKKIERLELETRSRKPEETAESCEPSVKEAKPKTSSQPTSSSPIMIYGTNNKDIIKISEGKDRSLTVTVNGVSKTFTEEEAKRLRFVTGNGNDVIIADKNVTHDLYIKTGDGDCTIYTGKGNDFIITGNGNNIIYSDDGNDNIQTGNGNNIIFAGNGDNIINTGTGNDKIYAGTGDNIINSGAGDDLISVKDGNNIIDAGEGFDTILAGKGQNIVYDFKGDSVKIKTTPCQEKK